jgi:hypothetical protein
MSDNTSKNKGITIEDLTNDPTIIEAYKSDYIMRDNVPNFSGIPPLTPEEFLANYKKVIVPEKNIEELTNDPAIIEAYKKDCIMRDNSPNFSSSTPLSPQEFLDRKKETAQLIQDMREGKEQNKPVIRISDYYK